MDHLTGYSDFRQFSSDSAETSSHSDPGIRTVPGLGPKRRAGRTKFRETRHPVYPGVRRRNGKKWVCEVREPNKKSRIWLGTFPTPEMAARAHDVAALALRGHSACLNFADSGWRLPRPVSSSPKDIQKTAAEAAELFRPESDMFSGEEAEEHAEQPANLTRSPENVFYMDEEAVFGMHSLIDNMAEGLLMSPPSVACGVHCDDVDTYVELPLWSYSI